MPETTRLPGVSAEQIVTAVRVHADRVHDAVRRLGADPDSAVEVVETSALDLVEVVAGRPETVQDAVGWWFARARALGRRVVAERGGAQGGDDLPLGGGLLSCDEDQLVLSEALEALPERERVVVLLRDSYDLPAGAVGAAVGTDADGAMELVGRARLAFLQEADGEVPPALPPHASQHGALARLAEGAPVQARDATVRRHVQSCAECRAVHTALRRAHLLLAGLTVVALPAADRAALLAAVEEQARALLPSEADLLLVLDDDEEWAEDEQRLLSPVVVLAAIVLATALGIALGVLLSRTATPVTAASTTGALPPVEEVAVPTPAPFSPPPPPDPRSFEVPAPPDAVFTITPTPSPERPAPPAEPAAQADPLAVALSPSAGPNGAEVVVTGTGWPPGTAVDITYFDTLGRPTASRAVGSVGADGRFSTTLTALDPAGLPGPHVVQATGAGLTATASYDAQA